MVARRVQKDGATYFGPFYPATAMRETLRLVRQLFPLRTCRIKIDGHAPAPVPAVLHPPLQRARAPGGRPRRATPRRCRTSSASSRARTTTSRPSSRGEMEAAAEETEVRAGRRPARPHPGAQHGARAPEDHLHRGRGPGRRRGGAPGLGGVRAALLRAQGAAARPRVVLLRARGRRRATARSSPPSSASSTRGRDAAARRSCSPRSSPEAELTAEWLAQRRGGRVELLAPQRGRKRELVAMAEENAALALQTHLLARGSRQQVVLEELERALGAARAAAPHRVLRHLDASRAARPSPPWWCGRTAT